MLSTKVAKNAGKKATFDDLFELTNIDNMDYPPDISLEHKKRWPNGHLLFLMVLNKPDKTSQWYNP